ncbi:MAG: hypothetical protein ACI3VZ_06475 [Faecousia sp.]
MKKNPFFLNIVLTAVTGLVCAALLLVRAFAPAAMALPLDLPLYAAMTVAALVIDRYAAPGVSRKWLPSILLGGLTLSLLPLCAGLVPVASAWKLLLCTTALFGVLTALYTGLADRTTGKAAPAIQGLVLLLACQCLQGIL